MKSDRTVPVLCGRKEDWRMGLFGKKKSTEEILAEGRVQYEKGDLKKAFLTLHGLAGKGEP